MMHTFRKLKNWYVGSGGTASGAMGALGSVHNVCHSVCVTLVSALAVFGIALNSLPLMFLQTYQTYFWWAALVFTAVSLYFYLQQANPRSRDRFLIVMNFGFLLFGLPFPGIKDYLDFFRFTGGSLVIAGLFLLLFGKRFKYVHRPVSAEHEEGLAGAPSAVPVSLTASAPAAQMLAIPKMSLSSMLFAVVIGSIVINQYFLWKALQQDSGTAIASPAQSSGAMKSRMKFTPFDVALAKEKMDQDGDGVCDTCGMPIQTCIDSGQMECNMGQRAAGIGVLGSAHIHADFKVFVDGQAFDFSDKAHMNRMASGQSVSSMIHVDSGSPLPEKTGDILHMHTTGVPLEIFFRSIGMKLDAKGLTLADGKVLQNGSGKTLKSYVNERRVERLDTYAFQDLDKILISYGPENDPAVAAQFSAITDFAAKH